MLGPILIGTYVLVLSMFVGFDVIGKVAPTLHNALIAALSAVAGASVLGALYAARTSTPRDFGGELGGLLGTVSVALGTAGVIGGFILASRALGAAKNKERV